MSSQLQQQDSGLVGVGMTLDQGKETPPHSPKFTLNGFSDLVNPSITMKDASNPSNVAAQSENESTGKLEGAEETVTQSLSMECALKDPNHPLNVSVSPANPQLRALIQDANNEEKEKPCICMFCRKEFSSHQALGGHQNAHRRERALLKRANANVEATRNSPMPSWYPDITMPSWYPNIHPVQPLRTVCTPTGLLEVRPQSMIHKPSWESPIFRSLGHGHECWPRAQLMTQPALHGPYTAETLLFRPLPEAADRHRKLGVVTSSFNGGLAPSSIPQEAYEGGKGKAVFGGDKLGGEANHGRCGNDGDQPSTSPPIEFRDENGLDLTLRL